MKIRITRSTVCGGVIVEAGQIVDANPDEALLLITIGKATAAGETPAERGEHATTTPPERRAAARRYDSRRVNDGRSDKPR